MIASPSSHDNKGSGRFLFGSNRWSTPLRPDVKRRIVRESRSSCFGEELQTAVARSER
jgi:hypothetical protein